MDERELYYVKEHHRLLLKIAQEDKLIKSLEPCRPSLLDAILEQLGDMLVKSGQKLKLRHSRSQNKRGKLSEECA